MTLDFSSVQYQVYCAWEARQETPDEIAARLQRYIDTLIIINPILAEWRVGRDLRRLYEKVRADLPAFVRKSVSRDDWGKPALVEGYSLLGMVRKQPDNRTFGFRGMVGNNFNNHLMLETDLATAPDPATIDYTLYRSLVLTTATCWQPSCCGARPADLIQHHQQNGPWHEAWMLYVPPEDAASVQTTGIPIVERAPDGGLFLAATTEPFTTDNLVHFEAARRLGAATRHLNTGVGAEPPPPKPIAKEPPKKRRLSEADPAMIPVYKDLFGDKWTVLFQKDRAVLRCR